MVSSDDGINVAGGMNGSGMGGWQPGQLGQPVRPDRPGQPWQPGQGDFGNYYLYINGGYIVVDSNGDGIDSNGFVEMTAGNVIVHGPTENMNGALDHYSFKMSGGFLVAAGSSGMAQAPDTTSTQNSILVKFRSVLQAGTLFHIQDSNGDEILSFVPTKRYQSIAFSAPKLIKGSTYVIFYGGNSTGIINDGLYQGGKYTPGNEYTRFTISSAVTMLN